MSSPPVPDGFGQAPPGTIALPEDDRRSAIAALLAMGSCYWVAAILIAAVAYLVIAVPTALVTTPVFGRSIPVRPVDHVIAITSALLIGMTWAARRGPTPDAADERGRRRSAFGGLIAALAVGCPVCNKLVLVALGTSGALSWWAPLQPLLGAAAVVLLATTLRSQLRRVGSVGCELPQA